MSICRLMYDEQTLVADINKEIENSEEDVLILRKGIEVDREQLDQMEQVLYAAEMHAMVSPRINDGSILSLPYDLPEGTVLPFEKARSLTKSARRYLPFFSRVPAPSLHCTLIKRSVLRKLGLLNGDFRTVEAALLAYSCEINCHGFNVAAVNHVFVESQVPKPLHDVISIVEMNLVTATYPWYAARLNQYLNADINACDRFLELLDPIYHDKPRLLLDCSNMATGYDGTTEVQTAFLKNMWENYADAYEICVLVSPGADQFHQLSKYYRNVYYPDNIRGKFHIAYLATPPFYPMQYDYLNGHCLKTVFTMLDMISSRCNYLWVNSAKSADVMRLGLKICDGMISISDASMRDYREFFNDEQGMRACPMKTIYIAAEMKEKANPDKKKFNLHDQVQKPPFPEYILIAGNPFPHKAIKETIQAVKDLKENFVIIGNVRHEQIAPNVFGYLNGRLPEDFLHQLYAGCKLMIFPSLYEGFGLPIVHALKQNKCVIVNDNGLNHELIGLLSPYKDRLLFYKRFSELPNLIEQALAKGEENAVSYTYTWRDVVKQMEAYIREILHAPVDPVLLQKRYHFMNLATHHGIFQRQASAQAVLGSYTDVSLRQMVKDRFVSHFPKLGKFLIKCKHLIRK